jgi:hypothetical protein
MSFYNQDDEFEEFGVTGFALLGRNPVCGCPLAIDMSASTEARVEFEERGLLLEFLTPSAAQAAWDNSFWPCHHSKTVLE